MGGDEGMKEYIKKNKDKKKNTVKKLATGNDKAGSLSKTENVDNDMKDYINTSKEIKKIEKK